MTTRCRIAPSPTGPLHIGTARTALFNYLFAKQTGGTFVLRLEDTDRARSAFEFEQDILEGLYWLGLEWDEGPEIAGQPATGPFAPYRQSLRRESYAKAAQQLLAEDKAYPCFCTSDELAEEPQGAAGDQQLSAICRPLREPHSNRTRSALGRGPHVSPSIRLCDGSVEFDDLVRGHVSIETSVLGGDLVIVRSDGSPLYHFSVVVDDIAMEISHVIRGEDHLSNTPKHLLLFQALGAEPPTFAHLPLILNPDRSKMSKRKAQTALDDYRAQGYVREAIVNHLALLGWSSGTDEDVFSLDELVERFSLDRVQPSGAIFGRRAPRVAQRSMDPQAPRRRPCRPSAAVPRGFRRGRGRGRCHDPQADRRGSRRLAAVGPRAVAAPRCGGRVARLRLRGGCVT